MARILLIEDDAALRMLYRVNLEARGKHTVYTASTIKDAYTHYSSFSPIDLIILDAPYGLGEIRRTLAHLNSHQIPVIVTTTLSCVVESISPYPNIRGVLVKPFPMDELLNCCG